MEINQLHYFTIVAKMESITKAASVLYLTQSALSRSIAKLEAELGTNLFDRDGGRLVLNDTGRKFLEYAEEALNVINAGVQYVKAQQDNRIIRFADYGATSYLSDIADQCQAYVPMIDIEAFSYEYLSNHVGALSGVPDVILTPEKNVENYVEILSYKEKWAVIFNKKYQFVSDYQGGAISTRQLQQEPVTFFGTQTDLNFLNNILDSSGNIMPASEMRGTAHAINRCKAIGIIPVANVPYLLKDRSNMPVVCVPVSDQCCERYMYLQRHKGFLANSDDYTVMNYITRYIEKMVLESDQFLSDWIAQF